MANRQRLAAERQDPPMMPAPDAGPAPPMLSSASGQPRQDEADGQGREEATGHATARSTNGFRRVPAPRLVPLPQLRHRDRPAQASSSSRSVPSAPAACTERRAPALAIVRPKPKEQELAELLVLPAISRHFESRLDHYCPEAPELPPPLPAPPPAHSSGALTDRPGRSARRAFPNRAASQSARRSPEDMVHAMLQSSAGFSPAPSLSPSAEQLQEAREAEPMARHTAQGFFRKPAGAQPNLASREVSSETPRLAAPQLKRPAPGGISQILQGIAQPTTSPALARPKLLLALDEMSPKPSPTASPRASMRVAQVASRMLGAEKNNGQARKKDKSASPAVYKHFASLHTQEVVGKLEGLVQRGSEKNYQFVAQGERRFMSIFGAPEDLWGEEEDEDLGLGRTPLWKHKKRERGQRLQRLESTPAEFRRPPPEDFGTAAAKEQQKICDSIRSNLSALGGQRKQLVELRQSMQTVLRSAMAMAV